MNENPFEAPTAACHTPVRSNLRRRLAVTASVLTVVVLFATLPLMLTLLVLLISNAVACLRLLLLRDNSAATLAFLTGLLMFTSLIFTEWGFSSRRPVIHVSWFTLIPACFSQLLSITMPVWRW